MARNGTVLVLGATGGIGGEVARQLRDAGWQVRALRRGVDAGLRDGIQWMPGDAMDAQAVREAARGCEVIVHAVNPPGYRGWSELVLPMLDNTIAAARAEGATIVLPGSRRPLRVASSRMCSAIRSLILPVRLSCSHLA